jgi:protein-S-isoprenylcysteine O-methyltransferase Ste14
MSDAESTRQGAISSLTAWSPFAISIAAVAYLGLTGQLVATGPVSAALQLAGLALNLWARFAFRVRSFHAGATPTSGGLVTHGPYRFLRHPVYGGLLLIAAGGAVAHHAPVAALAWVVVVAGTVTRAVLEESLLRRRYPEYADYAAKTARFVPGVY